MAGYLGAIPVPQATQHRESFTATSGQTTFNTAGYTVGFLDVYLNGVHQSPADFTATNGSDVVLASGASADDVCDIISYTAFEVADQTFTGTTTMDVAAITGVLTTTAATVFNGGFAANNGSTITTDDNTAQLALISTDADANNGPVLELYRNSASPAVSDALGFINFYGENDADEKTLYGQIRASIKDASDGTEDARFIIQTAVGGTQETSRVEMTGTETVINEDSKDLDFRVESNDNANMLFVDGGNDRVGIGTSSPSSTLEVKGANNSDTILTVTGGTTAGLGSNAKIKLVPDGTAGLGVINVEGSDGSDVLAFQTNGSEAMRIDATGAVTKPLQPAFLAQVASAQTDLASYTNVLIFGTEIFDQNADFNPSNGIFTAPVTGKYMLSTFIGLDQIPATGTGVLQLQIVASNRTVYAAFDPIVFDATSTKYTFTQSLLLDMDASDTAKIQVYMPVSSSTVDINTQSFFSGYLVA